MTKNFYRWFIFFFTSLVFVSLSLYLGVHTLIAKNIVTEIFVYGITGVYGIFSIWVGSKIWRGSISFDYLWFIAEQFFYVGMAGTIAGLMVVLQSFENFDINNVAQSAPIVPHALGGAAVAFFTTLSGLIYSICLKNQLAMAESL